MKTHVLKREYADTDHGAIDTDVDVERPYSGMQTPVFEVFDEVDRLCRWVTEDDLVDCAEALP